MYPLTATTKDNFVSSTSTSSETLINDALPTLELIDPNLIARGHARRMGHLENYFALLQRQKLYTNFTMYYELNKSLKLTDLTRSLRELILNYPILATTIVPKGYPNHTEFYESDQYLNEPYPKHDFIKILDELKINDVIINEQQEYQDILTKIKNQYLIDGEKVTSELTVLVNSIILPIYQLDKLNWRILILDDYKKNNDQSFRKIVYISNHCNSDAMTSYNLVNELLKILNKENISNNEFTINQDGLIFNYKKDFEKMSKLPPPITDLVNYKPTIKSIPQFVISALIKKYLNYKSPPSVITKRLYQNGQLHLDSNVKPNYHHWLNLTPGELGNLRQVIKSKNCSITGFLQTILFFTLKKDGKFDNRPWDQLGFDISIPNDTRKLLPPDELNNFKFGSNVGGTHYSFSIAFLQPKKFWSMCEYYTKVIQTGDYLIGLGSIMVGPIVNKVNIDKLISDSYLGNRRGGIILSNIGMLGDTDKDTNETTSADTIRSTNTNTNTDMNTDTNGTANASANHDKKAETEYTIKDVKFIQDVGDLNFSMCVNCCSTAAGGIQIGLSTVAGSIWARESEFHQFCRILRQEILTISEKGETPSFVCAVRST